MILEFCKILENVNQLIAWWVGGGVKRDARKGDHDTSGFDGFFIIMIVVMVSWSIHTAKLIKYAQFVQSIVCQFGLN